MEWIRASSFVPTQLLGKTEKKLVVGVAARQVVIRACSWPPSTRRAYLYSLRGSGFIHFSSFKRIGDPGRASDGKDCSVRQKAALGFRLFLMGVVVAAIPLAHGCGSGAPESGTPAPYNPEADKTRLDAMREGMQKQKGGLPGTGDKAKPKAKP